MRTKIITAPAKEPITLQQAKDHLRLDSGTFSDQIDSQQSIPPGVHVIAAAYSLIGAGIDRFGKSTLVSFVAGTCGVGGTVDIKIQDSDDDIAYSDVQSFAQVTTANDNTTYEIQYNGTRKYIRVVGTVAVASCEFGVNMILGSPVALEDTQITEWIILARRNVEALSNYALITQTWELYMDYFPRCDIIEMPHPPLQSVTSIKYYETDGTENTFSNTLYQVDADSIKGRIGLNDGEVWPSETLRTLNGVIIRYIAGFGDDETDVPSEYRQAILFLVGHYYENREATAVSRMLPEYIQQGVMDLIWYHRIVPL